MKIIGFLLQNPPFDENRWKMFKIFYRLLLGDFDDYFLSPDDFSSDLPNMIWAIFVFSTLFLVVIILNLLIAIISDTYDKVIGAEMLANNYEKITIIQDIEQEIKKKEYKKLEMKGYLGDYLYIADFQDEDEEFSQDFYSERMRNKIDKVESKMLKMENRIGKMEQKFERIDNIQNKIFEKIENIDIFFKKN